MALHKYNQIVTSKTTQDLPLSMLVSQFGSEQAFIDYMMNNLPSKLVDAFVEGYRQQGVTDINILWARVNSCILDPFAKNSGRAIGVIAVQIEFETDRADLQASPIGAFVIIAIGIAVALFIAACTMTFWLPVIIDWLKSMTTKEVTSEKYDWVKNPDTGEYEWKKVSSETKTEPDIGGIGTIGLILIAIVVVMMLFMFGTSRLRK